MLKVWNLCLTTQRKTQWVGEYSSALCCQNEKREELALVTGEWRRADLEQVDKYQKKRHKGNK